MDRPPTDSGWERRRTEARRPRLGVAAVSLLLVGTMVGLWACAPRTPAAAAGAPGVPTVASAFAAPALEARGSAIPAAVSKPAPVEVRVVEKLVPVMPFEIAARHEMRSTAYCLKGPTRTGVRTRNGIAAADPKVLPLGSVVKVARANGEPLGFFVVMDTGGKVKGNKLDLYMDDCAAARGWGSRRVVAEVLRLGISSDD